MVAPEMKIVALAGGVGASKFLLGLSSEAPPENITIIANTGDDWEIFGLHISPDLDTITYTLAGLVHERGWGIAGDTFHCLSWLERYGQATWFKLGDRDLATHIYRTEMLHRGRALSEVTDQIRRHLGVRSRIIPMTDLYVPTRIITDEGEMHLQEYFVLRKCEPRVRAIRFEGIQEARPSPGALEAILDADAIIFCPSNPMISILPILSVPGLREAISKARAAKAAITPIVSGKAFKGPAADMLRDLGHEPSALGVARLYEGLLDLFVLDEADAQLKPAIEALGMRALATNTVMETLEDKRRLARETLEALAQINRR